MLKSPVFLGVVGVVAVVLVTMFVIWPMLMPPPDDLDISRSKPGTSGVYSFSIEPENEPVEQGAVHVWLLTVTTPAGDPVDGAEIRVDGGMPGHGHGLPTQPQASDGPGDGVYRIEGVRFNMGGWWELKFLVSGPAGEDSVVFNIVL